MGMRAATVKKGIQTRIPAEIKQEDSPYAHLAVSIIIQAYEDLKALDGRDTALIENGVVGKWEIFNFFFSDWCGFLLGCQTAMSQDRLLEAARSILKTGGKKK